MFWSMHRSRQDAAEREWIRHNLIGMAHTDEVNEWLRLCPAHRKTELLPLPRLTQRLGLGGVRIKAEWTRMGSSSFKALGGAYAVATLVKQHTGRSAASALTFACASAGNHGLSVAAGARVFGARAVVYLSHRVPERFAERLRDQGAEVVRSGDTYEDSMAAILAEAERQGWLLVSDSSWPGYLEVPLTVMRGYTVLLEEAAVAMEESGSIASHVFVQAGVGGLAAAAAAYLRDRWGNAFQFVVVEPEGAPCLLESVRRGTLTRIAGAPTILGRLDCKEPSLLAFDILSKLAEGFMTVRDEDAQAAANDLTNEQAPVSPCGAAGAAGLIAACRDEPIRRALDLNPQSQILLIGTE